ncbi:MAG TPA: Dabb family protein [bacterium]|nr:Dabb family protein [bacterium]
MEPPAKGSKAMLKHIVFWKLKPEAQGAPASENGEAVKRLLEGLKPLIPEILELEVGFQIRPSADQPDLALYSRFKDEAALEAYQRHPEHLKVKDFIGKVVASRHTVDYLMGP